MNISTRPIDLAGTPTNKPEIASLIAKEFLGAAQKRAFSVNRRTHQEGGKIIFIFIKGR